MGEGGRIEVVSQHFFSTKVKNCPFGLAYFWNPGATVGISPWPRACVCRSCPAPTSSRRCDAACRSLRMSCGRLLGSVLRIGRLYCVDEMTGNAREPCVLVHMSCLAPRPMRAVTHCSACCSHMVRSPVCALFLPPGQPRRILRSSPLAPGESTSSPAPASLPSRRP